MHQPIEKAGDFMQAVAARRVSVMGGSILQVMNMEFFTDFIGVLSFIGLAAIAAIWFFVPFAIFGTKSRLDDLIEATDETNKHLADIKAILTHGAVAPLQEDIAAVPMPKEEYEFPSIRVSR